jgi:hypothetical protein
LRRFARVDAVGLEQPLRIRPVRDALQQEGHEGCTFVLGHIGEQCREVRAVLAAVVRRHLHAEHQHPRASAFGGARHRRQVGLRAGQRQAAQCVVAAQFEHHMGRPVLCQQRGQA